MCGEDLLLDAADRKDLSSKCDFARHSNLAVDGFARQQRKHGCGHGDAGRWTVFRDRAFRDVNVNVILCEIAFGNAELGRVGAGIAERRMRGFLHDVAELSCQC